MRTPFASVELDINDCATLFFMPQIKNMYYAQFDKAIDERHLQDFDKTQSLLSESLSENFFNLCDVFYTLFNHDTSLAKLKLPDVILSLIPDTYVPNQIIMRDIRTADALRYSSLNAVKMKDESYINALSHVKPDANQFETLNYTLRITHSEVLSLIIKICACCNTDTQNNLVQNLLMLAFTDTSDTLVYSMLSKFDLNAFENYSQLNATQLLNAFYKYVRDTLPLETFKSVDTDSGFGKLID